MTLSELAAALEPIAYAALKEDDDHNVKKIGVVLAAIMGAIDGGGEPDQHVIDALSVNAGLICEHRLGRHER